MGSQGPVTQEGLHDSEEDLNIELSDNEAEDVHLRPSAGSGTAIIEKVASQAPGESRSEQPQTQSDSFEGEPAWKRAELDEAELDIEVIVSEDEESGGDNTLESGFRSLLKNVGAVIDDACPSLYPTYVSFLRAQVTREQERIPSPTLRESFHSSWRVLAVCI